MKTKFLILYSIIFSSLSFISCTNELDRPTAHQFLKKCIASECNTIKHCEIKIEKTWTSDYYKNGRGMCTVILTNPPRGESLKRINFYLEKGLIELERENKNKDCGNWTENRIKVTEKGKKHLINENSGSYTFLTASFILDEITGIYHETNVKASVEYKVKFKEITPFGEFFNKYCVDIEKTYSSLFYYYDDGWRLNNN